jgi:hypothetical protein
MLASATHSSLVRQLIAALLCLGVCGFLFTVHAGMRGPGKYSGAVVFDRWDTCFLLSGVYIMYVGEDVKEELRPYGGESVQIDASEVLQPMNPGDGLVKKYEVVGPAPSSSDLIIDGVKIEAASDFDANRTPAFVIQVRNDGNAVVEIANSAIGPTLLGANKGVPFSASDGKSVAWVTRSPLVTRPLQPSTRSWTSTADGSTISPNYTVDQTCELLDRFDLGPGQDMKCRINFKIPAGQYQFIVGYGGGVHQSNSLISNAISFSVANDGAAVLEPR